MFGTPETEARPCHPAVRLEHAVESCEIETLREGGGEHRVALATVAVARQRQRRMPSPDALSGLPDWQAAPRDLPTQSRPRLRRTGGAFHQRLDLGTTLQSDHHVGTARAQSCGTSASVRPRRRWPLWCR